MSVVDHHPPTAPPPPPVLAPAPRARTGGPWPADRRVAEGLEAAHNRPVWLVESLSRDAASGRAVMCSSTWSRPDSVRIIVELDGPVIP